MSSECKDRDPNTYVSDNPLADSNIRTLPWPYNLMACLNTDWPRTATPVDFVILAEHMAYITEIVGSYLDQRKSACIFGFFRDGLTAEQIGKQEGVTRSRIAENIHMALRRLHRESIREKILYGPEIAARQDALDKRLAKLQANELAAERREALLDQREAEIQRRKLALAEHLRHLGQNYADLGLEMPPLPEEEPVILRMYEIPLLDLGLSVRSYNCLYRRRCESLGDVLEIARRGELRQIRNLGDRCAKEILTCILERTGEDLFAANTTDKPAGL